MGNIGINSKIYVKEFFRGSKTGTESVSSTKSGDVEAKATAAAQNAAA
jgi:hypothetical protein